MSNPWSAVEAALESGSWHEALRLLGEVDAIDDPVALELRARAAYGAGHLEACIGSWERLHVLRLQQHDAVGAAVAAANAALFLLIDTGLMAPVRGWIARARRAVEGVPGPTAADALIATVLIYERFLCGDAEAAARHARDAIDLGTRLGLPLPVAFGRVAQARLTILSGDVVAGLTLLDEAGSALLSEDMDDLAAGMLMCEMICAAQGLGDHERAREWTTIMDAWRGGRGFGTIHGRCRLHKAELLRQSGPGDAAEAEALAACAELQPWMRREFGWPLAELGVIRLRRGDHRGAAEAFAASDEHGWAPQPGSALLRLATGDQEAAARQIARAIAEPPSVPSKEHPPIGELRLAPLLAAQTEIAAESGDLAVASAAAQRLGEIAGRFPNHSRDADAALAAARVALLTGDATPARQLAQRAVDLYDRIEEVFEASCARVLLGRALSRLGEHEAAAQVWDAASSGFARFGPSYWAGVLIATREPRAAVAAHPAPLLNGIFAASDGRRTVELLGRRVVVRDLTGFRALAWLLSAPGKHVAALDLVEYPPGESAPPDRAELVSRHGPDSGLPMIDEEALAAYRRRLAEIDTDIAEADATGDTRRSQLAHADRSFLVAELARASGLGGRARVTGGSAERARTSVTRTIRYAIRSLADEHPEAAAHLDARIRTGSYCWYEPDPAAPVHWTTEPARPARAGPE